MTDGGEVVSFGSEGLAGEEEDPTERATAVADDLTTGSIDCTPFDVVAGVVVAEAGTLGAVLSVVMENLEDHGALGDDLSAQRGALYDSHFGGGL